MLRPGDRIAGYRIDDILGSGGMAHVYRAEQLALKRPVALKVLSGKLARDPAFRERFRREGIHVAALDHPNVIPIFEAGEVGDRSFIAMRLVEGPTLADKLADGGLDAWEALSILGAVAGALDVAHDAGLVHRDVKPQNVLLTATTLHPYLADFGVAKGQETRGLTQAGGFVGSVSYASPEQFAGAPLTAAADVYSLAVIAFECLTGEVPFPRDSDLQTMRAHTDDPVPALEPLLGAIVPEGLDAVFARGLAKEPDRRFARASDLISALKACLDTLPAQRLAQAPPLGVAVERLVPRTTASAASTGRDEGSVMLIGSATVDAPRILSVPAGATTADRRRMRPEPAPAPAPARRTRTILAICGAIAAIAAGAGALAGQQAPRPAVAEATSGPLAIAYRAPWTPAAEHGAPAGLRIDEGLALHAGDARLEAGPLRAARQGPDPLPAAIVAATRAKHRPVLLGNVPAVAYDGVLPGGRHLRAFVITVRDGSHLAVTCDLPRIAPTRLCDTAAASVRLHGAVPVVAGPAASLASALATAMGDLQAIGRRARNGLGGGPRTRRAAARALSRGNARAAQAIERAKGSGPDSGAATATARALSATARHWRAIAAAAAAHDRAADERARTRLRASQHRVRRLIDELRARGYATARAGA